MFINSTKDFNKIFSNPLNVAPRWEEVLGCTLYDHKIIVLFTKDIENASLTKAGEENIILHEIAHALHYYFVPNYDVQHFHNNDWKRWAKRVGAYPYYRVVKKHIKE